MGNARKRKFRVCGDDWRHVAGRGEKIKQGYLALDPKCSVQVCIGEESACLTVQCARNGVPWADFEYPVPIADALQMLNAGCLQSVVAKTRYKVRSDSTVWEVDEFSGDNRPLVLAQLATSVGEEATFRLPQWVGEAVTVDPTFSKPHLATHPDSAQEANPRVQGRHFHVHPKEPLQRGLKRIVLEELDAALDAHKNLSLEDAVHETRKSIKKIRAVLRLMRPVLKSRFNVVNRQLQKVGRRLSKLRDAHALLETFDTLQEKYANELHGQDCAAVRQTLQEDAVRLEKAFYRKGLGPALDKTLKHLREKSAGWSIPQIDIALLASGIGVAVKGGRAKHREATRHPTPENRHAWRRRAKDLRYQLKLLSHLWPAVFEGYLLSVERLEEQLGMDHNLTLLRNRLEADAMQSSATLMSLIAAYQRELRIAADVLGQHLYAEKPRWWVRRVKSSWEVERKASQIK